MKYLVVRQSLARILAVLVVLFVCTATIIGCWDKQEIEELGFVVGIAVDLHPDTADILLTAQIAKPHTMHAGTAKSAPSSERGFWSIESVGKTVYHAVAQLNEVSPRTPFWAHNDLVIFGEALARQGIGEAIDFLVRHRYSRQRVRPVVVRGSTGHFAAFSVESELSQLPSDAIIQILENTTNLLSTTTALDINELTQALESPLPQFVLPVLELVPVNPDRGAFKGELRRDAIAYSPRLNGSAVFKRDRLVGFLSRNETRGRQWVVGGIHDAVVAVPHPRMSERDICFTVTNSATDVRYDQESEVPHFRVEIEVEADLSGSNAPIDVLDPELQSTIEGYLAEAIESEVRLALTKAQSVLATDIFGFGELLYRYHPHEWTRFGQHWDETFPTVTADIIVDAQVLGTGLTLRSPHLSN